MTLLVLALALLAIRNRSQGYTRVRHLLPDRFQRDVLADLEHRFNLSAAQGACLTDETLGLSARLKCDLIYRKNSALGKTAMDYVSRRFQAINDEALRRRFGDVKLPAVFTNHAVGGSGAGYSLTTLIPLVLILMTITGAVYPAIDLTAGERERGTLEALIAAPVPRIQLLLAKYAAVVTVALLTAAATKKNWKAVSSRSGPRLMSQHLITTVKNCRNAWLN